MSAFRRAYLTQEGELSGAVCNLEALAKLVLDAERENAEGMAGLIYDQIDRLKAVQASFEEAHQQEKGGTA